MKRVSTSGRKIQYSLSFVYIYVRSGQTDSHSGTMSSESVFACEKVSGICVTRGIWVFVLQKCYLKTPYRQRRRTLKCMVENIVFIKFHHIMLIQPRISNTTKQEHNNYCLIKF